MASDPVLRSSMDFLKRHPLYDSEKLYEVRRKGIKISIPRTNADLETIEDIPIHDLRGTNPSLANEGFTCLNWKSHLQPEDFLDRSKVIGEYLPQLTAAVKASLGASRVQIFDFMRRNRHPEFPIRHGNIEGVSQPAPSAHIDTTHGNALRIMRSINPDDFPSLCKRRWKLLIAWHPIRGPVRDWPLAVCDHRTVNVNTDLQPCDLIHQEHVTEEYKVHYSPQQKWYFLRDQMPNEVFLLLQADSEGSIGVPHCAFPNPESVEGDPLRESFDVRLLVFFDD